MAEKETKQKPKKTNPLFDSYQTDLEAEHEGRWYVPMRLRGAGDDVPAFRLARFGGTGNKRFTREHEKLTRKERRAIESGDISTGHSREITLQLFIRASLLEWRNVIDAEGKSLSLNEANARLLFEDETMNGLLRELIDAATEETLVESVETDAKNS